MKVIVLAGGISAEREVSLRSGQCVAKALNESGHTVQLHDPQVGLDNLLVELKLADVVFPALHGAGGEDGELQEFLEKNDILFVGSNSQASKLCFDKYLYGNLLQDNGFNLPKTELIDYSDYQKSALANKPHVIKPNDGGSSIDTFIVRNVNSAPTQDIESAFKRHEKLLLQELVEGQEITVPVLEGQNLSVVEIITPSGIEFDYENKYNGAVEEACPPRIISLAQQKEAQNLAQEIHKLTGCRDLSRTDMIVATNGQIYILETNTLPGMTDQSTLPKSAHEAGLSMSQLCDVLVRQTSSRE